MIFEHNWHYFLNYKQSKCMLKKNLKICDRYYTPVLLFPVIERKTNQNYPMHRLKDYANDIVEGYFYEHELQLAFIDENTVFKIERL